MEESNINLDMFNSEIFRASFLSKSFKPFNHILGYRKNKNEVVLFGKENLPEYLGQWNKIKMYGLSKEECEELKLVNDHKLTKIKIHHTIIHIAPEFFTLGGGNNKRLRQVQKRYINTIPIEIRDEPNSIDEVFEFINRWKKLREDKIFQFFCGYDINFFQNYYSLYRENLIAKYFYESGKLVGFTIIERVQPNLYNLLIRKADISYIDLCKFVDLSSYKFISDTLQEPYLINLGGDVGSAGLKKYKSGKFPVFKIIENYDAKLIKI
jgi:hypothetical protein